MRKVVKRLLRSFKRVLDILFVPLVFVSAHMFKFMNWYQLKKFPLSKKVLLKIGVFPIVDHYYQPMFHPKHLRNPLSDVRSIPAIDWNVDEQLVLLKSFNFEGEFENIPNQYVSDTEFHFFNGSYNYGDAEYWYSMIRLFKPKKIIEIGSGNSTKMARLAIDVNKRLDANYQCKHICVEPYEMPWLEKIGVEVIREKVEEMDVSFFEELDKNDILFIDSSHMIRPQGDVLFEYLELLPTLKSGVIVHIHDIYSPRDYPKEWVVDENRFWNEQYLLEAFLSYNSAWKIIGSLNFLSHNYFELLKEKCPRLPSDVRPSAFYIVRT